jgi:hypothetical protein
MKENEGQPPISSERGRVRRDDDQVHVVGHETVAEHPHAGGFAAVSQNIKVCVPVVIREEDILAVVAALRDVMRHVRHNNASDTRHRQKLTRRTKRVKNR